jgi:hypothetical protein
MTNAKKFSRPGWIFDDSPIDDQFGYGQRAVDFLHVLKHPKSRSPRKAFELPLWMERIVRKNPWALPS